MLKHAYQLGVAQAYLDSGVNPTMVKEAFLGNLVTRGISALGRVPGGNKLIGWGIQHPILARTAAGAAMGGLGGAAFGDEGGMMRGALMGAGLGAGAGLGRMAALGKGGRAANKLLRNTLAGTAKGPRLGRRVDLATKVLNERAGKAGLGALGGGVAGLGLGAGFGQAAVPAPAPAPKGWF
jgi:hypothetical protein